MAEGGESRAVAFGDLVEKSLVPDLQRTTAIFRDQLVQGTIEHSEEAELLAPILEDMLCEGQKIFRYVRDEGGRIVDREEIPIDATLALLQRVKALIED
jgi:hypothetical protein